MNVLYLNLILLKYMGLYVDETCNKFLQNVRFAVFLMGTTTTATISAGLYLYYHIDDMASASNALVIFTGGIACSAAFISFGTKLKKLKELYWTLQPIVNSGERILCNFSKI